MPKNLLAVMAIAALFGVGGFWGYRAFVTKPHTISIETPVIEPPTKQKTEKPIISQVPGISLRNRTGVLQSFRDFAQPAVVYNFWATWCAPCRREIPLLNQLRRERGAQGVEIVGVAVDFRDAVLKYATEIGIEYPLLIGEQDGLEALDAFGIPSAFPISVFADSQKRIVAVKLGELHGNEARFILDQVADLNAGRLDLATAKQQISAKLQELAQERAKTDANTSEAGSQRSSSN